MKKIIIGLLVLGLIGGGVIFFMLQGNAESEVVKTEVKEVEEKVEVESGVTINDMSELEGGVLKSDIVTKEKSSEVMFMISGLKDAKGRFDDFSIEMNLSEKKAINVEIQMASVYTANQMRDDHLKEADFFNVEEFPTATFSADNIELGDTSYIANGSFTMLGHSDELSVPFSYIGSDVYEDGRAFSAFEGKFSFDRTKFGMESDSKIGDSVKILFYTELVKQ